MFSLIFLRDKTWEKPVGCWCCCCDFAHTHTHTNTERVLNKRRLRIYLMYFFRRDIYVYIYIMVEWCVCVGGLCLYVCGWVWVWRWMWCEMWCDVKEMVAVCRLIWFCRWISVEPAGLRHFTRTVLRCVRRKVWLARSGKPTTTMRIVNVTYHAESYVGVCVELALPLALDIRRMCVRYVGSRAVLCIYANMHIYSPFHIGWTHSRVLVFRLIYIKIFTVKNK